MKFELEIGGMTCLACARTIEHALTQVPGVAQASVSYPTRRATVSAAPDVTAGALRDAVARAGYDATLATDGPVVTPQTPARGAPGSLFDYDLLVIGSGGAGMAAAIRAAELGRTAAIVEQADVVGGTCVNVGCIPSKFLIEAAQHYHAARTGFPGIAPCDPQRAWDEILRQKRALVESLRGQKYLAVLAAYPGITLLHGHAELRIPASGSSDTGDHPDGRAHLDGVEALVDGRALRARAAVIATGARPAMPPIPGLSGAGALDSTTVMALERLPASLLVIGAGAIGLELGQAFQRFGVRVIVVEEQDRVLPTEDPAVSDVLQQALAQEGMEFHTGARVTRVERTAAGVRLTVQQGSLTGCLEAEQLLVATGRVPDTETLGLDAAGVRTDDRGAVAVDAYMRTSHPRVFAAGDVTGGPAYVYVAAYQGGLAAQAALAALDGGAPIAADLAATPRVTFTDPQVAAVGLTVAEARQAGLTAHATALPVAALPRAAVSFRRAGTVTLVAEVGTDRLLGAHVVAPNAGDMISEAVIAVRFGLTTRDLVSTLHPYLTWGEAIKLAAQTFTRDVATLSCCA